MTYRTTYFKPNLFLLLLLLMPVLLAGGFQEVKAQDSSTGSNEPQICTSVDLVIVIDQSVSMFDVNDTNARRFDAAKTIVNYLGNHAAWLCPGQQIHHRVAVIGFGDRSVYDPEGNASDNPYSEDIATYLPPTTIPPEGVYDSDLALREAWKDYRDDVLTPLIYSGVTDQRNATDHRSGLLGARDILQQWRAEPIPGLRRQSVIMITDGEPCLFYRGCDNLPEGTSYNINTDLNLINQLADADGSDFPFRGNSNPDSIFVSILLLSQRNQSFSQLFKNTWQTIADTHGGTLEEASNAARLSPIIAEILQPIVQSSLESVTCGSSFWITPYVYNLTFFYAFALVDDEEIEVSINIVNDDETVVVQRGIASSPNVMISDYVVDGQNETYVFAPPIPGEYRLEVTGQVDCADVLDAKIENRPVSGEVTIPNDSSVYPATPQHPFYNEQVADKFRVEVVDNNGAPLVEFPGYPLLLEAVVTSVDGSQEQQFSPTDFIKVEDGIYESKKLIETPVPGGYTWELKATVKHPDPSAQPLEVFSDSGNFTANEVALFGFTLDQPSDGTVLALNTVQGSQQQPITLPVEVSMTDMDGNPLNNRLDILPDLKEPFEARLYQGSVLLETIPLQVKPGSNHQFVGEFTNAQAANILSAGAYTVDVVALWDREDYDVLSYAPFNKLESVSFTQYEVVPLSANIIAPPEGLTLHTDDPREAFAGVLQPFEFAIEIFDARDDTQTALILDDVLTDKLGGYQVSIIAPSGNSEVITLTLRQNERLQQFVGVAGLQLDEEGNYDIKLDMNSISLPTGYAWAEDTISVTFSRADTTWTRPAIWRTLATATAIIVAVIAAVILYLLTGGPTGILEIVGTGVSSGSETIEFTRSLKFIPRTNRVRAQWLKNNGVKWIKVRRGRSLDPDVRYAVHISAIDEHGASLYEGNLDDNVPMPFIEAGDLRYKRHP